MAEQVLVDWSVDVVSIGLLESGLIEEVVLNVPGPQGPANTDYQIGGTEPTDPNIKIWYKLT